LAEHDGGADKRGARAEDDVADAEALKNAMFAGWGVGDRPAAFGRYYIGRKPGFSIGD